MDVTTSSSSRSTDKLLVMMAGLETMPAESFSRIKSVSITWEAVTDEIVAPNLTIEYYEKG